MIQLCLSNLFSLQSSLFSLQESPNQDSGPRSQEARRPGAFCNVQCAGIAMEVTTELPQESPKATSLKRLPKAQLGIAGKRPKSPINPTSSKRQRIESPCSATATAEAQKSKWSKYLDASFFEDRSELEGFGQHRTELDECVTTEVVVDDEVHPDFI